MNRLLPVGSVVMLDLDIKEKVMIIGRLMKMTEEDGTIWDYCGCIIPQGLQNPEQIRLFNHKDIRRLLFVGYQDEEELGYSLALSEEKEKDK
ncbi:DUF4176 domain-containing protein [Clostridium saccharoperbutylacetonicum]|uniref:DUF4176 domain-containing protein n=1 Tax=Clostridium saccharoperbutylacetonicum TaxID=36745 RepID=UPI0009839A1F|nr:DUF4176 domain-containing protein [Clostridium saccharoperbutylacetonicum]AQR94899.1 hypothetical protein CLSAP_22130 [Clostridium saccharoperbutylacetonicum]NSB30741.1 hypothetical protein [Clostridium saccharoperbutylacetonicum]